MINNLFYRLRWKLLLLFVISLILSLLGVLFLFVAAQLLLEYGPSVIGDLFRGLFRSLYYSVGALPVALLTGVILFIGFVVLLSHRSIRYLGQITKAVQQISSGDFDVRIPVRSRDELGELGENINRMAQQLKVSIEEERRAERTKNELITSVSHDLRTPLTSINGYLGLVEQDRYRDEVELRYYVNIAYDKAQRLTGLINDLFEYARASGGGMKLKPSQINLVEMLGQVAAHFRLQLERVGMECRLFFPEEKIIITADGDKLVRVFENLFINAMNYGKDGKYIDLKVMRDNGDSVVHVINYGDPIPNTDLPHIFDRFYRVEKSRAEETGGSGLGLAIAKTVVELHGGTIAADSDQLRTQFEIRLPITE
ncbi:cell wall metabolism sensor histidine kinase WalK [Paenibacillus sp. J2TS4]|uniref:sensor histidine kinase n=1 Tax=Paenibacillus sp. J2TS4 TaxID=2807194 RepID=UPI001B20B0FA|nr:HAMP domain-containing sensor histidine kinase [Paenibacillus sp. J2TS4]GIP33951.1 two-component sensor histidine kinase [Paenibacillus sp. J2TS4]